MTLQELSKDYEASANLLRKRLQALRKQLRTTEDEQERQLLQRKIRQLEPILTEMNALAELTAHYYDRGYRPDGDYRL